MTLRFIDSFQYENATDAADWVGGVQISTSIFRTGDRSLSVAAGSGKANYKFLPTGETLTEGFFGASLYVNTMTHAETASQNLMGVCLAAQGAVPQTHIYVSADNEIVAYRWGTVLGRSAVNVWQEYTWHYIDVWFKIHDSLGELKVWIDDALVLNLTEIDTKYHTQDGFDTLALGSVGGHYQTYVNDVYFDEDTRRGPCKVTAYKADANGFHTDFTPSAGNNYENVDEAIADDDTTYNDGDAVGEKDCYDITSESLDTIYGIRVRNTARKEGEVTPAKFRNFLRQGGTDYPADTSKTPGGTYKQFWDIWETDPSDSNPWTQGKLDSGEFGLEVTQLGTTTTTTTT